jgi:Ala-tRNA(Pro) deacylase
MCLADFLQQQRISYHTLRHPPAYSASRRARNLRIDGIHVARSVLVAGPMGWFLVVLPSTHELDLPGLGRFWGGEVRLALREEAAGVFRDCEWGVVSPFGNRYGLPTLLDETLRPETWMVIAAETHSEAVLMDCADFERISGAYRGVFARPIRQRSAA